MTFQMRGALVAALAMLVLCPVGGFILQVRDGARTYASSAENSRLRAGSTANASTGLPASALARARIDDSSTLMMSLAEKAAALVDDCTETINMTSRTWPAKLPRKKSSSHKWNPQVLPDPTAGSGPPGYTAQLALAHMKMMGEHVWRLVDESAPVSELMVKTVSVIPQNTKWQDLTSWKHVATEPIDIVDIVHTDGKQAVKIQLTPSCFYGGEVNGTGMFLKDCKLNPTYTYVDWMYNMAVDVVSEDPHNIGTPEEPVAQVSLIGDLKWYTSSKSWTRRIKFLFDGDGAVQSLFI